MPGANDYQINLAIVRTALIAYDGRNYMSEIYQPLNDDGQIELYLFNIIHGWFYLLSNSIVDNEVDTLKKYVAVATGQIRGPRAEYYKGKITELLTDRFPNYKREMKLVKESADHLPAYFFNRLYKHPMGKEPIDSNVILRKFPGDTPALLNDYFKTHVNNMWATYSAAFGDQVPHQTTKVAPKPVKDESSISIGTVLKVIGWFALLGVVIYAITSK